MFSLYKFSFRKDSSTHQTLCMFAEAHITDNPDIVEADSTSDHRGRCVYSLTGPILTVSLSVKLLHSCPITSSAIKVGRATVWFNKPEPSGGLIATIFLIASATDYVDGYIARKMVSYFYPTDIANSGPASSTVLLYTVCIG